MKNNRVPKHSFELLFASLLAVILLPPAFALQSEVLIKVALTCVLISSLYIVTDDKPALIFGGLLAAIATLTSWGEGFITIEGRFIYLSIIYIIFFCYICFFLLRFLIHCRKVSSDIIFAAMCLYVFIGNIWTFIYALLFIIYPNAFTVPVGLEVTADTNYSQIVSTFSYYSFVTLTTLGYGDISPIHPAARAWVSVEAIVGQFYLAIVLAKLVGLAASEKSNNTADN